MTTLTYQDNILIAETLEKLQDLNSELYGDWYTKLYHAVGHEENTVESFTGPSHVDLCRGPADTPNVCYHRSVFVGE